MKPASELSEQELQYEIAVITPSLHQFRERLNSALFAEHDEPGKVLDGLYARRRELELEASRRMRLRRASN